MDMVDKTAVAILIGTLVAHFLVNTGRVVKAIDLCKECTILFNNEAALKQAEFVKSAYGAIYFTMLQGYERMNDHANGIECCKTFLDFLRGCGERAEEGKVVFCMAKFYHYQSKYKQALELYKKALSILMETGDREQQATCYRSLGTVYQLLSKYEKAEEYQKKALLISEEIGDKKGEASCYESLGTVYQFVGEYRKAEECRKKALMISKEIGDRRGEAAFYGYLGTMYQSLSEYDKAEEYQKKALVIRKEIGHRDGEVACYAELGTVYQSLGKFARAVEFQEKALVIATEIGDKHNEGACYGNLGIVYQSLGEDEKADVCHRKALRIAKEIGDRKGEATSYGYMGTMYDYRGEYGKAEEYQNKALLIRREIGDREGEAACYVNLGAVYKDYGKYGKAEEYHNKALVIKKELGDRRGEASCYANLGSLFYSMGKYDKAKEFHEKSLAVSRDIGDINAERALHFHLACDVLSEGNTDLKHEAFLNLFASISKCEEMRRFLVDNDQFKISLLDQHIHSYYLLSALFCSNGNPDQGLYVVELGRARALADLIAAQYSGTKQMPVNLQSWVHIERTMKNEINCSCLYISYWLHVLFVWVLKRNELMLFRQIDVNEFLVNKGTKRNVDEVFSEETVRKFYVLPPEQCEDRSLFLSNVSHPTAESSQQDDLSSSRLVEDEEAEIQQPVPTLVECYKMIIAPVADFLDEREILIVPDRLWYKVPFAALKDESEKYLSETFRIRIVPSLTILKLIQDSPADYHSQTGALIVGEPDVGEVLYRGRKEKLCPLPCARREAEMIGRLLGVQPLLGKQATKQIGRASCRERV